MLQTPICLTPETPGNSQLLYFTSSSLTSDDRFLVFLNDRTSHPNLYALDLQTGQERQISHNEAGFLQSYVYFDGRPHQGLGKASVSLDSQNGRVYFLQGDEVCLTDLDGQTRVLARLPDDQVTAFTHVSGDGKRLCVPTTDARIFEAPGGQYDALVQRENLSSYLRVFDTQSGEPIAVETIPRAWVTHVQFHPTNFDWILYNHEWPGDCGVRRMWLWDGQTHRRLRDENAGRSRDDWTCHEMWTRDGRHVIYHGQYRNGPAYLGRWSLESRRLEEVALPAGFEAYGHFTVGNEGELVCDGHFKQGDESPQHGEWISLPRVNWSAQTIEWAPLCRHASNWDSQDSHPHPIFTHAGDAVLFTSNQNGRRQIFRVPVPNTTP